jgi:hypothetical protein
VNAALNALEDHDSQRKSRKGRYSTETAFAVARLLADGWSLREIVELPGALPRSRSALLAWIRAERPEVGALFGVARFVGATRDGWASQAWLRDRGEAIDSDRERFTEQWAEVGDAFSELVYARTPEAQREAMEECRRLAERGHAPMLAAWAHVLRHGADGAAPSTQEQLDELRGLLQG